VLDKKSTTDLVSVVDEKIFQGAEVLTNTKL